MTAEIRPQMAEDGKARQFAIVQGGVTVGSVLLKRPASADELRAMFAPEKTEKRGTK